jgi:mannose-6-phosphate isomerase-like protein (cupin superfamily)
MRRVGGHLGALALLAVAAPAPAQPVDMAGAEHVTLGTGIEGWFYLKRDELSVVRMRMAPAASEDRHIHRKARLFVTMLSGSSTVEIDGKVHVVAQGQGIEIPPGTPHKASNPGKTPVELLVVAMPPSAGDREPAPNP